MHCRISNQTMDRGNAHLPTNTPNRWSNLVLKRNRWWPTMGICDVQNFVMYDCPICREQFQDQPCKIICGIITTQTTANKAWRNSLIEYLTYGYLKGPRISKGQHKKMAWQSREHFIEQRKLKKIGDMKICIAGHKVKKYLHELHVIESGGHLNIELMWHLIMFGPYWWPTCRANIKTYAIGNVRSAATESGLQKIKKHKHF